MTSIPQVDIIVEWIKDNKTAVATTSSFLIGLFLVRRYLSGGVCRSKNRLHGKTVVITGANSGIGKEVSKELAKRGARLIFGCRDVTKGREAADKIGRETGNKMISVYKVDVADLDSVREFSEQIHDSEENVDILINNAGVYSCPYALTKNGFETQFGVNYAGHFLLTHLLLDLLKKSVPSRIINTTSVAYKGGKINFDNLNMKDNYKPSKAYCNSKLAVLLFTRELSRRLKGSGVTVNSVNPGLTNSNLGRHVTADMSWPRYLLGLAIVGMMFKTPKQGAQTTIYCAVEPSLDEVTGQYFSDCMQKDVSPPGDDDDVARHLWDTTVKLVGLPEEACSNN
ncbi:retinol dehydrogenase 11-like [Ptychodera flava]|uniref:retinol dehydrogenase 11-like n=1 Tax=Ptychodera flava TaxID=63121 RepID=UPI00396A3A9E